MLRKDKFVSGEYYHIYNRGIDKRIIFHDKQDKERFLMLLYIANSEDNLKLDNLTHNLHKQYKEIMSLKKGKQLVSIVGWCLMPNHFHILIKQDLEEGITKFMRKLGVGYSMYFNNKYKRQGALFGGPFKSKLIEDDSYFRKLFSYIHLNPLEIKFPQWEENISLKNKSIEMENFLKSYIYSSYQDYTDINRTESSILNKDISKYYFDVEHSFKNFIKQYLEIIS
ncbi:MAG: transposase [Candidatus Pacebacteria bacterium]|nr:transposase [Candidatus Paceibacterota bacterium]